jgi:glycosyltransferase involved in cell wall biosynthesis
MWAFRLMRELVRLGVEVHVAVPQGELVADYEGAGVIVHRLQTDFPARKPWLLPARLSAFRALVERVAPDVIHSHFVGTTLTMRLALGRASPVPRFFQVAGPLHLEHRFFRWAEIGCAGAPDRWIGSCRWTADRYRSLGIEEGRVSCAYYGVDPSAFVSTKPVDLRKELGLPAGQRLVGMVAYLYAPKRYLGQRRGLKGHEDLIDALAILARRRADVTGVFVGGAWGGGEGYEQRVRSYAARKLGRNAVFLGTRRDVLDLYPAFDVAVHPSHSENVGGAGESQLMGIPTIATSVGGFPDAVAHGQTGWLVPPRSPARLADAIGEALSDPEGAKAVAREGQRLARQRFDVRTNAEKVLAEYRRAADSVHRAK